VSIEVLIVEDKDAKFEAISAVVGSVAPKAVIHRARTVVEAERMVREPRWKLLLLDISMDISGDSRGALSGGHANLGGIDVVETMFYENIIIPTIVVTGFDYFIAAGPDEGTEYIGLSELEALVRGKMPVGYLGYVRYGVDGWVNSLIAACGGVVW